MRATINAINPTTSSNSATTPPTMPPINAVIALSDGPGAADMATIAVDESLMASVSVVSELPTIDCDWLSVGLADRDELLFAIVRVSDDTLVTAIPVVEPGSAVVVILINTLVADAVPWSNVDLVTPGTQLATGTVELNI